ncbi:MAG TPA: HlyD family secretion protein [Candidatus Methylomirabilis sp.]|nr:HlyD family secretion protein [Candidatus Methylomirabilis sp.]
MTDQQADPVEGHPSPPGAARPLRKWRLASGQTLLWVVAGVVGILGLVFGSHYYRYAVSHESTDNAFIEGHIIPISPEVAGHALRVSVRDNQEVNEGDILVEIDPRDLEVRLQQARATLAAAIARERGAKVNIRLTSVTSGAGVEQAASGVQAARAQAAAARSRFEQTQAQVQVALANADQARAQVTAAEAEATRATTDVERFRQLYAESGVSRQQLDFAVAAASTATAQLEAARKRLVAAQAQVAEAQTAGQAAADTLRQAEAQVGEAMGRLAGANAAPQQVAISRSQADTSAAEIEQAQAAVKQAELQLSYTRIRAPEGGRVTRKNVEPGAYVQVGQSLMALVPRRVWVIANFKETQLTHMRPGQPADIKVDAYPGRIFKGHVDSIQSGTGARFSLLPPENATGNYVKVVQRVPVKIVFDEPLDPSRPFGPGMSVVPTVKVR